VQATAESGAAYRFQRWKTGIFGLFYCRTERVHNALFDRRFVTVEHASTRADAPHFSHEEVAA
jgi:hypothetical protein